MEGMPPRNAFVYYLREVLGMTYTSISKLVGIDAARCSAIYKKMVTRMALLKMAKTPNPSRYINWVEWDKVEPPDEDTLYLFYEADGYMYVTTAEGAREGCVRAWAELPEAPSFPGHQERDIDEMMERQIRDDS